MTKITSVILEVSFPLFGILALSELPKVASAFKRESPRGPLITPLPVSSILFIVPATAITGTRTIISSLVVHPDL